MQCKEVEGVLEQEGLAPLPEAARAHLAECGSCRSLVADLNSIVSMAQELPAEAEPPARVWVSLRAQLEQEGIIKEPAHTAHTAAPESAHWWSGFGSLFHGRSLATAAVGLVIAGAAFLQLYLPGRSVVESRVPADRDGLPEIALTLNQQERSLMNMQLATTSPVDVSLQQNLRAVNEFIADCERRLKEEPQDELAREYLSSAYRQKAELLSAMIDRGRSVN